VQFNIQLQWEINLGVLKVAVESGSKKCQSCDFSARVNFISLLDEHQRQQTTRLDIDISAARRVAEVLLLPWHLSASREERNMILSRSAGPTRLLISPSTIKKTVATHTPQFKRLAEFCFTAPSQ
jgi:hypothetical protein